MFDVEKLIKKVAEENLSLCRRYYKSRCVKDASEVNLFMGIGFISCKDGLSKGLPLDCLNMILTAKKIREKLRACGKKSIIYLLLADHMAYDTLTSSDILECALRISEDYQQKLSAIVQNLDMNDYLQIYLSSNLNKEPVYQQMLKTISQMTCEDKEVVEIRAGGKKHQYYFEQQTAQVEYFRTIHQCKIKISWTRQRKTRDIKISNSYDESHFDRIYEKFFPENDLSVVFVDSGYSINDDNRKVIPYCAASQEDRILFDSSVNHKSVRVDTLLGKNILTYYRTIYASNSSQEVEVKMETMIEQLQSLAISERRLRTKIV